MGKSKIITAKDIQFEDLNANILDIPNDIDKWVHDELFAESHYIFTKTESGMKNGICTHCLKEFPLGDIAVKHNQKIYCPECAYEVTAKDNGRGKKCLTNYGYFYLLQPTDNGGIVLRTFYCKRQWSDSDLFSENELPVIEYSEHFRIFMHGNRQACYKRVAFNWGYSYEYWNNMKNIVIPHSHYGNTMAGINFIEKAYRPENWKDIIAETDYRYSCLDIFSQMPKFACKYLELYSKNPILLERMIKQGFQSIIIEKLKGISTQGIINFHKDTVEQAFKLDKQTLHSLPKNPTVFDIEKSAFLLQHKCSAEAITTVQLLRHEDMTELRKIFNYLKSFTTVNHMFKYFRQQARNRKLNMSYLIKDYGDYIGQIQFLSLPLNEETVFPPDLSKAHTQSTRLAEQKKVEKECKKLEQIDTDFKPIYEKLYQKYAYENDNYIIRPPKGKQELFIEGTVLSHCVYTNYSDKYINGNVLILLVREKDNPDTPFYTLELNPKNNRVVQCRTFRNRSYLEDKDLTALMKEYQQFLALPLREKKKLKIKVA